MLLTVPTKTSQQGFALVEVLLCVGLSTVLIVAIVALGLSSVRAGVATRANLEAGRTVQREVERLKLLRDTSLDWSTFVASVASCIDRQNNLTDGCHLTGSGDPYSVAAGPGDAPYSVKYSFGVTGPTDSTLVATDSYAKVVIRSWWKVGDKDKSFTSETILSNWRAK